MKQQSLAKNAILNVIKQVCTIIFPLITFPYISRILETRGYGVYSFSKSVAGYFLLIAALGIKTYAIREGASYRDDKDKFNKFCNQIFTINFITTICAFVLLLITISVVSKFYNYRICILILSSSMFLSLIGADWLNSIFEDYTYLTMRYIAFQVASLILMFAFVKKPEDVVIYCAINVMANSGGNVVNIFYIRKYAKLRLTWETHIKQHIIPMVVLFANALAITIYVNVDISMMGFYRDDDYVGIYSFASNIYNIIKDLINAMIIVFIPRIAYLKNKEKEKNQLLRTLFSTSLLFAVPVSVGLFLHANAILTIVGGNAYAGGYISLRILSPAIIFGILSSIIGNCILIVQKREKYCLVSTAISSFINMVLNFIFIPTCGIEGAAITTLISESVNFFSQLYFARSFIRLEKKMFLEFFQILISSSAIVALYLVLHIMSLSIYIEIVLHVACSVIAYLVLMIILKNPTAIYLLSKVNMKIRFKNYSKRHY